MSDQSAAGIERRRRQFAEWVLDRVKGTTSFRYPFVLSLVMPTVKAEDVWRRLDKFPDVVDSKQFGGRLEVSVLGLPERRVPMSVLRIEWAPLEDLRC